MVTADTDPAQALGGHVDILPCDQATQSYNGVELAAGPLFLTDVRALEAGKTIVFTVPATETCNTRFGGNASEQWLVQLVVPPSEGSTGFMAPMAGGRIFVPAGRKLCARDAACAGTDGNFYWAGFRPY